MNNQQILLLKKEKQLRFIEKFVETNEHTVVQTAIFEATKSWGMLRVNWEAVDSPNIVYPITATPAYIKVQIAKLIVQIQVILQLGYLNSKYWNKYF